MAFDFTRLMSPSAKIEEKFKSRTNSKFSAISKSNPVSTSSNKTSISFSNHQSSKEHSQKSTASKHSSSKLDEKHRKPIKDKSTTSKHSSSKLDEKHQKPIKDRSNGSSSKTAQIHHSKSTTKPHSNTVQPSFTSKLTSNVDPNRVAEFLRKKQKEDEAEERRRAEEKRRLLELRAVKEKEKAAVAAGKKRRSEIAALFGDDESVNGDTCIDDRDGKKKTSSDKNWSESSRNRQDMGGKSAKWIGNEKSKSIRDDEPPKKKSKFDDNVKDLKRKPISSKASTSSALDFTRLMQVADKNKHRMDVDSDDDFVRSISTTTHKSLPCIPRKSSTLDKSNIKPSLDPTQRITNKSSHSSSKQTSITTKEKSISNSTLKSSSFLEKSKSSSTSKDTVRVGGALASKSGTPMTKHPNGTKDSKSSVNSKVFDKSTPTGSSKKESKLDTANGKMRNGPTQQKPTPLMKKALVSATVKSAALSTGTPVKSTRSATLVSTPIFDTPRDIQTKPTPMKKPQLAIDGDQARKLTQNGFDRDQSRKSAQLSIDRDQSRKSAQLSIDRDQSRKSAQLSIDRDQAKRSAQNVLTRPPLPSSSRPTTKSSSNRATSMSEAELFNRKMKLQKEEERARLLAVKKLSKNPNWEEDDEDEDEDDEEEIDSDMDDFIDDGPLEGEEDDYHEHIKSIFGYDRNKYRYVDDDDDACMESSYGQIEKEEKFSARVAVKEDYEEFMREEMKKKRKASKY